MWTRSRRSKPCIPVLSQLSLILSRVWKEKLCLTHSVLSILWTCTFARLLRPLSQDKQPPILGISQNRHWSQLFMGLELSIIRWTFPIAWHKTNKKCWCAWIRRAGSINWIWSLTRSLRRSKRKSTRRSTSWLLHSQKKLTKKRLAVTSHLRLISTSLGKSMQNNNFKRYYFCFEKLIISRVADHV